MSVQLLEQAWKATPFSECLAPTPTRGGKLLARDYKERGRFPVVDQGQRQIAGWTNDESLVIQDNLPYVVFGDHTRAFKFVAEPFVLGADGTQLLKPAAQFNPRFFFYACLHLDIPNRGYNRHFTLLKERSLPQPSTPEQEKIAAVLWNVQRAAELEEKLAATAQELKAAAMRRLFSIGLNSELSKDTSVGPMPESWTETSLGALCENGAGRIQTGPFGSQLHAHEYQPVGVPVVNPTHLVGDLIDHVSVPKVAAETANRLERHKLKPGDILFARRGEIGRHGLISETEKGWLCGTGCFLVRVDNRRIDNAFLSRFLSVEGVVTWLKANAAGVIMPNLNNTVLANLPIYYPGLLDEQRVIADALQTIDQKISLHERRGTILRELFASLLHRLMTGEVRVDKLEIDVAEVRA